MRYYIAISRRTRLIGVLIAMMIAAVTTFIWIEHEIKPAMFVLAENKINRIATRTVSQVIEKVMQEENKAPLIHTTVNEEGKVVLIQPDTVRFNMITARITEEIGNRLEQLQDVPIIVPLGQIWGNALIANYGPQIPIYMKLTGSIDVRTQDRYEHVGINQTKHRMYLDVEIHVRIAVPFDEKITTVKNAVPLAEYVIVGDVPTTYVELPQNFLK